MSVLPSRYEVRSQTAPVEIRRASSGAVRVVGYASIFDEPATISGEFVEVVHRGAFADAVHRDDVPFLIEHAGLPLARTTSRTLRLSEDHHGLRIETDLHDRDPDVQRIIHKLERGDMNKMSFAFGVIREEWDTKSGGKLPVRHLRKLRLYDVSVVTHPAYGGTEIALASLEGARRAQDAIRDRIQATRNEMWRRLAEAELKLRLANVREALK